MKRTYTSHAHHISIPIQDVADFNIANIINPEHATISTRTVHLKTEEFERLRPILEEQDVEVALAHTNRHNRGNSSRMPYDASLVLRPLEHGDFVRLKDTVVEKRSGRKMDGQIGIVRRTSKGLMVNGIMWSSKDFTRMVESRIERENVPEQTRFALEQNLHPIPENTVDVELHIRETEQDQRLLQYLLSRHANVTDGIADSGDPVRKYTFKTTRRAAIILHNKCFGSRRPRRYWDVRPQERYTGVCFYRGPMQ